MADFHRFVTPTYFGGMPGTHDLINVVSGGIGAGGSAIVSPQKPAVHVNQGTYFVAFGEAATSANVNRGLRVLAENTDFLDNIVHANQSIPTVTSSVVPVAPVASVVITGDVYVGSGVPNLQSIRSGLVAVVDSDFIPVTVFNGVSYDPVLVTLIHDGASFNQVGTGYFTNPTVDFTPPIPAGQTYRLAHYVRGDLKTQPDSTYTRVASGASDTPYLWALSRTIEVNLGLLDAAVAADILALETFIETFITDTSLTNWRDDVHDSGAGIFATRHHIFWVNRLIAGTSGRFLASSDDDAPRIRVADRDLKWSTPAVPPAGVGCQRFADSGDATVVTTLVNIWSSVDLNTWTQRVTGSGDIVHWSLVVARFLSCSSTTGQTWFATSSGTVWTLNGATVPVGARGIANTGTRWVIVGDGGNINTSDDVGGSWTARASGTAEDLLDVVWWAAQSQFVAVGRNGTVTTSPDGITWTLDPSIPVTTDFLFAVVVGELDLLHPPGDTLLVGGGDTLISIRANAIDWRHLVVPAGVDVGRSLANSPIGVVGHHVVGLLR